MPATRRETSSAGRWVVTYRCPCGRALHIPSARPGDLVLVGRGWCWNCGRYATKAEADATSHFEATDPPPDDREVR